MIVGKITAKSQVTVPRAVRLALGLAPGDELIWEIEGDRVVLSRAARNSDPFTGNISTFSEWSTEADCKAFADL